MVMWQTLVVLTDSEVVLLVGVTVGNEHALA